MSKCPGCGSPIVTRLPHAYQTKWKVVEAECGRRGVIKNKNIMWETQTGACYERHIIALKNQITQLRGKTKK
jgi:hypothetical protein